MAHTSGVRSRSSRSQAAAGTPPSAVALLETYAQLGLVDRLPELFADWERWAVEVLDSHVAFPLLGYFRSSHDNLSWISALGTVLDSASLVLTTICDVPRGEAKLFKRVGTHLVEDIANLGFRNGRASGLDRAAFDLACDRLEDAGYAPRAAGRGMAQVRSRPGDVRRPAGVDGVVLGDPGDLVARRSRRPEGATPSAGRSVGTPTRPTAPQSSVKSSGSW